MTLKVSVIMATHDRPDSLKRAVDSIVAQRHLPEELIIVNDGSADIAGEIAEKVRNAGVRFCCQRQDYPSLTASRNRGMAIASGDVFLLADDDVVLPADYLSRLVELYQADTAGVVAGIGGLLVRPGPRPKAHRLFEALSAALGQGRWSPRVCAARYVSLPPGLRGRLLPARRLFGGAISIRAAVARTERFEEAFGGCGLAEDREFSFRLGRRRALFVAPALRAIHESAPAGRIGMKDRGRMYAANSLHIARNSVDPGAGTYLLLGYDLMGMALLYGIWALGARRREHLAFAAGLVQELSRRTGLAIRRLLCAS
jgi:glycosyltransferase involved in cell wall biosynthesis